MRCLLGVDWSWSEPSRREDQAISSWLICKVRFCELELVRNLCILQTISITIFPSPSPFTNIRSLTELEHALPPLCAFYTRCPVAVPPPHSKATSSQHHQDDLLGLSQAAGKLKLQWLWTSPTVSQGLCPRDYWSLKLIFYNWQHETQHSWHLQNFWKARLLLLVPLKILWGTNLGRMTEEESNTTDFCWSCLKSTGVV